MNLLNILLLNKLKHKGGMTPTGTINIMQNGTVDVTNYASANVNVPSSGVVLINGMKLAYSSELPQNLDTSNVEDMTNMFAYTTVTSIPLIDTSNVTDMQSMFYNCANLQTIPVLDTSKVTKMRNMYQSSGFLTNETLNNILLMCKNATSYTQTKTLKYIGLSSGLASLCTELSNYSDFQSAGWSTGY